jgi:hypothetical protein
MNTHSQLLSVIIKSEVDNYRAGIWRHSCKIDKCSGKRTEQQRKQRQLHMRSYCSERTTQWHAMKNVRFKALIVREFKGHLECSTDKTILLIGGVGYSR